MNCPPKRCAICKADFVPACGKQRYCEDCIPYVRMYRTEEKARKHRYADAKASGKPLSLYPAIDGCDGCKYWRRMQGFDCYGCHYYFDTLQRRPCMAGKYCTVKVIGSVKKRVEFHIKRN